jgi:hypothetical protein
MTTISPRSRFLARVGLAAAIVGLVGAVGFWSLRPRSIGAAAPIRVSGTIRAGGNPVASFWLEFTEETLNRTSHQQVTEVRTASDGSYSVALPRAGNYQLGLRPIRSLPVGSVHLTLAKTAERVDLAIEDTSVTFAPAGKFRPENSLQLQLFDVNRGLLSAPEIAGVLTANDFGRPIVGLPASRWRILVDSPPDWVSAHYIEIDLRSPKAARAVVSIDLRRSSNTLTLEDSGGARVANATIHAGARHLSSAATGVVTLKRIVPGLPLVILAQGFAPSCMIAPDIGQSPIVQLHRPGGSSLEMMIGPESNWPFGFIQSPTDACFVPVKAYNPVVLGHAPAQTHVRLNDLDGDSTYQYMPSRDQRLVTTFRPGPGLVTVAAPIGCSDCAVTYPAKIQRGQ